MCDSQFYNLFFNITSDFIGFRNVIDHYMRCHSRVCCTYGPDVYVVDPFDMSCIQDRIDNFVIVDIFRHGIQ